MEISLYATKILDNGRAFKSSCIIFKVTHTKLSINIGCLRQTFSFADASVFRERSRAPALQHQQQALAEKFLRAIEDEREKEEEEEYRNQLRNLWNRYQLEEGDMEKELFDNDIESDYALNNEDTRKRSRQVRTFFEPVRIRDDTSLLQK